MFYKSKLKKFKLFWKNGDIKLVEGNDIMDAFDRAGYLLKAFKDVSWYEEIQE